MKIIHRAGRVHSNIDPVSRLRRCVPPQESPLDNESNPLKLKPVEDPLCNMFDELAPRFEEKLLTVATQFAEAELLTEESDLTTGIPLSLVSREEVNIQYLTSRSYSTMVQINEHEIQKWKKAYIRDLHFKLVIEDKEKNIDAKLTFSPYHYSGQGLIYFEDSMGNTRLCVPKDL